MLKTINPLLTGELLAILADMGHGDEIVIVDANFPAAALAQRRIQLPASSATDTLAAILELLPLDDFVDVPTAAMAAPEARPDLYTEFDTLLARAEGRPIDIELIDRFAFYDRTRQAYAVVATGERRLYGNLILKKGVLRS
ncbi:RbsD/FucU domain-containing protein [Salinisphaera sp. SPP-AMP-43]|uniref:RbsD/FucU family protein n=1 Tax=Salinisphaera sp. SPP-AMP-43 TaxID=3121288 RepID=UPI003C6DC4E6